MPLERNKKYKLPFVRGNQKAIRVKKALADRTNYYTRINLEALTNALTVLSPNTFKLWVWLGANADDFNFPLSSAEATQECSFSRSTYDKAIAELIEKKFLRPALLFPKFKGFLFVEKGQLEGLYPEEVNLIALENQKDEFNQKDL